MFYTKTSLTSSRWEWIEQTLAFHTLKFIRSKKSLRSVLICYDILSAGDPSYSLEIMGPNNFASQVSSLHPVDSLQTVVSIPPPLFQLPIIFSQFSHEETINSSILTQKSMHETRSEIPCLFPKARDKNRRRYHQADLVNNFQVTHSSCDFENHQHVEKLFNLSILGPISHEISAIYLIWCVSVRLSDSSPLFHETWSFAYATDTLGCFVLSCYYTYSAAQDFCRRTGVNDIQVGAWWWNRC